MLSRQEEEQERRETLENDRLMREQQRGSTFHQHGLSQAAELSGGRFAATGAPRVIGSTPSPASQYPAASSAHQTELPREEPLGIDINAMPELEPAFPLALAQDPGASERDASSSAVAPADDVERGSGAPSSPLGGPASKRGLSAFPAPGSRAGPPSTKRSG